MHFGAEVFLAWLVLAEEEHAGQRRNAQRGDGWGARGGAHKNAAAHRGGGLRAGLDVEAVGARGAWRVEQCVHRDLGGQRVGPHQPELGEAGEFLAPAAHGVDGQPARRQAVLLALAQRAEVARTLEDHQLVLVGAGVQVVVQTKACKAQVAPGLGPQLVLAVVKVRAAVGDVAHALGRHLVDQHRLFLVQPQMEEHGLVRQLLGPPQSAIRAPADVAHLVVVELCEVGRELVAHGPVGLAGAFAGEAGHALEVKALCVRAPSQQGGGQGHCGPCAPADLSKKGGKNCVHARHRANPVPAAKNALKSMGWSGLCV